MKLFLSLLVVFTVFFFACSEDNNPNSGSCLGGTILENGECKEVPPGGSQSYLSLPSSPNPGAVDALYDNWKTTYFRTVEEAISSREISENDAFSWSFELILPTFIATEGYARIRFDENSSCKPQGICTVSEGIGYGMVIAYFQNDRDAFERLWRYSRAFPTGNLMKWMQVSFKSEAISADFATDADIDIATSLYLAYLRWGDAQMLNDAKAIASELYERAVNTEVGNNMLYPGGGFRGYDVYNPSYFAPVAIRIFKEINPENNWQAVLDANYAWLEDISKNGYLVPDWADATGVPKDPKNGGQTAQTHKTYYLESVRVPWRLAWDYAWWGDERAKIILDRFAAFITESTGSDPTRIQLRYSYSDGSPFGGSNITSTMAQKASLCAAGLANPDYQWWLDACLPIVNNTPFSESSTGGSGFNYFHHILQLMYAQIMNGKYGGKPF
jgi:endo-1,4-beta-D-glucanase Y